jgi:hypothetical protein
MADLTSALQTHHQAVEAFLTTAGAVPPERWTVPRAPGKWSPGQVADHLAVAYEVNRGVLHPTVPARGAPRLLRPLLRVFLLNPVLRRGAFIPGSKTPKMLEPSASPARPEELLARLRAAANAFEADAAVNTSASATLDHPFFGRLPLADFVRFQEIHTRHHHGQVAPTVA